MAAQRRVRGAVPHRRHLHTAAAGDAGAPSTADHRGGGAVDQDPQVSAPKEVDQDPQVNAPRAVDQDPQVNAPRAVDQDPQVSVPRGVDQDPQVSAPREWTRTLR